MCVRAVAVAAQCTVAWHIAVNTQLKRRGLTSRAPKTSLIQYFRWRNRESEQLLTAAAESRQDSSSLVAEPKSEYIASGRTPLPLGFPREVYDSTEVTASAEVLGGVRGVLCRRVDSFFPTVCHGRERHTTPGDSVETPPKYFNSLFPAERLPLLHLLD